MSKQIRVSDEVYERLHEMQRPRETFSELVERLMRVYKSLFEASNLLGSGYHLTERPKGDVDPVREAMLERADLESRRLKKDE